MFIRTRDSANQWYTCDTQEWNQPGTCPIVSLKYRNADGVQKYYNIQNQEGIKDYNGNWYGFTAMFQVPLDVNQAYEVDFLIRGPPKNFYIYWDDVSIKPFLHVPAEPKYDSATLETKETICTGDCCELITSGDAETGNVQDWFDYMGGNVIKHPWGPPYSKFSYKHIGRPIRNSGPAQQIDTRCLVAGVKYKFTGLFKLALNTGPTYACDTYNYQSETVCPLFNINFRNSEGKWMYINAENENHPSVWEKDYFNKYEAIFEATPELANSDRAYIVIRGPPEKKQIFFDDMHLNPYFTDTAITVEDPLPVCDNECCELVRNGDAESGSKDDWINIGGGNLMIHPYGPPGETKSFKHLWRSGPNMGPGQVLNTTCLVPGEEYELTALLKVQDKNANPVKCDTTTWGTPTTCPLLRIRYVTEDGNEHYFNVNNRIPPSAWRETDFNLFTAFFTVTPALAAATDAHFLFSGPPTDYVIFFDNVSIKPWLHVPPPPQPSLHLDGLRNSVLGWGTECTGACCELVENGEGESLDGWKAFGGGKVGVSPNGAQGTSHTLVHMFRPYVHSGPGQRLNTACLVAGERYKFTAMYKLLDNANNKKCTTWNFHDPNACPLLSIRYKKSSGEWAYLNEANNMPLSIQDYGWNLYEATIIIPDALANSEYAYWVMRGLPGGNMKLYLDQVSFAPHLFNPAIETVPDKNADQACDGACCELVTSGNAQPGIKWKWLMFPEGYGSVSVTTAQGGANGESKSFVSSAVEDIHSGPGQILENLSCFDGTSGQTFMFKAMFKVENAAGQVYNCAPGFGTSDACPIFSIKITKPDGKFKWINGRNFHGDIINGFNNWGPYGSVFEIPTSLADATSAYWVMQGLPKGYKIYLDEVSLSPVEDWGF